MLIFKKTPNVQMNMQAVVEMKMQRNYILLQKSIMNSLSKIENN